MMRASSLGRSGRLRWRREAEAPSADGDKGDREEGAKEGKCEEKADAQGPGKAEGVNFSDWLVDDGEE